MLTKGCSIDCIGTPKLLFAEEEIEAQEVRWLAKITQPESVGFGVL